ncbi:hypothetical protein IFM89_007577 [Coptis chinensis]|uniref:Uncharacterized protein n=1 Tax=Coptis chinensis TaxID=261450 RepID=A0A835LI21_9MAGN|nr:hypothetical protein IFM89_007577 [Coptis chinensis]
MEADSWVLLAAAIFATSFLFLLKGFISRSHLKLPPGPKPWPILGNLNLIGSLPHQSIHDLSQTYGPMMQLQFGSFPVVIGSSVEMAREFLKIHDLNFASRPYTSAAKYTNYDQNDMSFAPYGPHWRHARKICVAELFSMKRLDSFQYIRTEELHLFLSDVYASCGNPATLKDHFSNFTLNNISRMVLGKKVLDESEELKKIIEEWFVLNGVFNIGDYIPGINFLDLQGYVKRMKALRKKIDHFLELAIDEHIARKEDKLSKFMTKDMLDVLLQLADDPNPDLKLSRLRIKGLTMDLLAGGTDTSTTAIEWAMSELLKHPEIFEQATEELDRVIGRNRWVEETDIPNLPYIKSIMLETMRMHPVAPLLAPHLARENCKVHGCDILRGTRVFVNTWSIGRDPTLWDAPNEFRPERFKGREIDVVKGQNFELLPFGSGRRMCPGYTLGLKLIESGLANLLHGFTWELPNQMEPQDLNMEEVFGLSVPKKVPLVVVAEPRLPHNLYSAV